MHTHTCTHTHTHTHTHMHTHTHIYTHTHAYAILTQQRRKGEIYNTNLQFSLSIGQFSKGGVVEEAHFLTEQTGEEKRASIVPVHDALHHLVNPRQLVRSIVVHVHHKL